MSRIISAVAAVASPFLITQASALERPAPETASPQQISAGCQFYRNVHTIADNYSFAGSAITTTPSAMTKAAAQHILTSAYDHVLKKNKSAAQKVSSKPLNEQGAPLDLGQRSSDIGGWELGNQRILLVPPAAGLEQAGKTTTFFPLPEAENLTTYASQCAYLESLAAKVHELSGKPVDALLRHAAVGAVDLRNEHDHHTTLIPEPEDAEALRQSIQGHFGGIGVEVTKKEEIGPITVNNVIKGYKRQNPAEKAGLQADDVVTHINGQSTDHMSLEDFVEITRGAPGENLTFTVKRENEAPKDYVLTRDQIIPQIVEGKLIPNSDTAVIKISTFNALTTTHFIQEVARLATEAHENVVKNDDNLNLSLRKIILDLRNNGGGLLTQAEILNDLMVDKGNEPCSMLVATGKTSNDDVVCSDTQGLGVFLEVYNHLAPELLIQGPAGMYLAPSAMINGAGTPEGELNLIAHTENGTVRIHQNAFKNLNTANIFELLKRLSTLEVKDQAGNILIAPEVIRTMERRAQADRTAVPGMDMHTRLESGESAPVLTVTGQLQNHRSASASEITAGIMKDNGVPIIGTRSFGKGSVQIALNLDAQGQIVSVNDSGYIIRRGQNGTQEVSREKPTAQFNLTTEAFFSGKTGLSNHGSGVPADIETIHGDFRDESRANPYTEKPGLVADDMTRMHQKPTHSCTLKSAFRGTYSKEEIKALQANEGLSATATAAASDAELRKTVPSELLMDATIRDPQSNKNEKVKVFDTDLACALAKTAGQSETPFVTITPHHDMAEGPAPAP